MLSAPGRRAVRASLGALAQARSTFQVRRLPQAAEQLELEATGTGIDWRKADGTKDHPVWASVPIETEPSKYDLVVLLLVALNPIRVYESIILSGTAGTEYGRLPWLALSVLGGYTSNAASEGCHSIAQLIMSDLQTSMGDDILQIIVCLHDGNLKEAVEQCSEGDLP
jgi:hypothetical protein